MTEYSDAPFGSSELVGVSQEALDMLAVKMEELAQKYGARHQRPKLEEISLLFDALDLIGLKYESLSREQSEELIATEGQLLEQYLKDDEEE